MPLAMRQKIEKIFGNRQKIAYPLLGRLANAVGYQYKPAVESVETGWLSRSAAQLGGTIEGGLTRNITDDMRYAFWAAGVPLSRKKGQIVVPPRPTFGPMYRLLEPKIEPYMSQKIFQYMDEGTPTQASATRKYTVFK
jgi:hypothetical protein